MHTLLYLYSKIITRSKKDLILSLSSLCVGIFLFAFIFIITGAVSKYFYTQSAALIGGDIRYNNNNKIILDESIKKILDDRKIIQSYEVNGQILVRDVTGAKTSAVTVRAVDNYYPLYGRLVVNEAEYKNIPGTLYVESKILNDLEVSIGESIYIGDKSFVVGGVITDEPDRVSTGFSFTPKIIMNLTDFESLGIDSNSARLSYKIGFRISDAKDKDQLLKTLTAYAEQNKLRYDSSADGPNSLLRGLQSVSTFVGVSISISLFLVYVNIASNLTLLLSRFRKMIALFKVLGLSDTKLYFLYSMIFITMAIVSGFLGSVLAIYASEYAVSYADKYFGVELVSESGAYIIIFSIAFSALLTMLSALPFLKSLSFLKAKTLLSISGEKTLNKSSFLYYLGVPVLLFLSMYTLSKDLILSAYSIGGLVLLFLVYYFITKVIVSSAYIIREKHGMTLFSVAAFLKWRSFETYVIGASIMTALSGMFIITAIKDNIQLNINQNIDTNIPALYIVNINPAQLPAVESILLGTDYNVYNIIRGRLLRVGDRAITSADSGEYTREFNLTYRDNLLADEVVTQGVWHGSEKSEAEVSIDQDFANGLNAKVGDEVEVFIQGFNVKAKITSVRKTNQTAGTPFFYLVYSSGVIDQFPKNHFLTANLSEDEINKLESKLAESYPNIIPIDTRGVISKVNEVLATVIRVVNIIGWPSIILGLILTIIMTIASIGSRIRDLMTMMVVGLKRTSLTIILITESVTLLIVAGLVSYIIAHVAAYALNVYVFNFKLFTFSVTPAYTLMMLVVILIIFTYAYVYRIIQRPLRDLLNEK